MPSLRAGSLPLHAEFTPPNRSAGLYWGSFCIPTSWACAHGGVAGPDRDLSVPRARGARSVRPAGQRDFIGRGLRINIVLESLSEGFETAEEVSKRAPGEPQEAPKSAPGGPQTGSFCIPTSWACAHGGVAQCVTLLSSTHSTHRGARFVRPLPAAEAAVIQYRGCCCC